MLLAVTNNQHQILTQTCSFLLYTSQVAITNHDGGGGDDDVDDNDDMTG